MSYERQCNCNFFRFVEQMLFPSGVMPLVPEEFRTYRGSAKTLAIEQPGVCKNGHFWGHTDDDYYRPLK